MRERVVAVIFEGGLPEHWLTREIAQVRTGVVMDNIAKLHLLPEIDEIILSTNYPDLAAQARALGVTLVEDALPFHFGRSLQQIVQLSNADGVICMGGAAAPFLSLEEFRQLAINLRTNKNVVYTNNPQSSDIVAFTPASAVLGIPAPENDNSLATFLKDKAGLTRTLMSHSVGVHFDLDTPTDVLIMGISSHTGPRARACLAGLGWDTARLQQAVARMAQTHCELGLIGRVNPAVMAHLNTHTFNRLRVFSEERGMKALAREEKGQVVSLLGFFLETVGPVQFFKYISQTCDVCFIDSRVLFAHFKLQLSEEERFLSDLGLYQEIASPWLKEFTRAAVEAEIPIVLGGHSLVTGGMWAIVDILRTERAQAVANRAIRKFVVESGSAAAGLKISSLWRMGVHGVTIVAVDSPEGPILEPALDFVLHPGLVLHCVGSEAGLRSLRRACSVGR